MNRPVPRLSFASARSDLRLGCHSCHATARNDLKRSVYAVANRLQEYVCRIPGSIEHVYGPRNVECGPHELVVLSIGRDAAPWISSLIEHHLALGARHVFFLDNGSEDDTIARASGHPHVSIFRSRLPFKRYEVGMRRWLIRSFGRSRWSLYCDVDEHFDYPGSDRLALPDFLRYLEHYGYNAVTAQMLDLFSDKPFSELRSEPDDVLKEKYRYYDLSDLVPTREVYWIRNGDANDPRLACFFGGIRKRFFGDDCLLLSKHPLVYADAGLGVYTYDGHFMSGARVADLTTVLLHYKYIDSLPARAQRTVGEGWRKLYGGLATRLQQDPNLCLRLETARELCSVSELVENGFLVVSEQYERWLEAHGR